MGMAKRRAYIQGYAATGGQMEESKMEAFEPPEAGAAPKGVKDILKKVYNGCRSAWAGEHPDDKENAANKESCSRIAWDAVKGAGWRQVGGAWRKEHVDMDDFHFTLGDSARIRMEGRKGRQQELADEVLAAWHRLQVEGDFPGHPFRGNQYGSGKGGGGKGKGKKGKIKGLHVGRNSKAFSLATPAQLRKISKSGKTHGSFKMYNKYGKSINVKTPTDLGYD